MAEQFKNPVGRVIDQISGLFLVWLVSFMILVNILGNLTTALIISLPLLAAEALFLQRFINFVKEKRDQRKQIWQTAKENLNLLSTIDSQRQLRKHTSQLFKLLPGFCEIRSNKKSMTDPDLSGSYQGISLLIRSKLATSGKRIKHEELSSFADELRIEGCHNGILVTNGEFSHGTSRIINAIARKGIKIRAIDRYGLSNLMLQANYDPQKQSVNPENPAKQLMEQSAPEQTAQKTGEVISALCDSIFRFEKAKSYFLFGIIFYLAYHLMNGTGFPEKVYLAFAFINTFLGVMCIYLGRNIIITNPLRGLKPDK